jgi:CheY-like chemotaxis protein
MNPMPLRRPHQRIRSLGNPTILVAEDDDDLRELVAVVLTRDGYAVLEATSGDEALRRFDRQPFRDWSMRPVDLVLSEVRMRGTDGLGVANAIRGAGWSIPVILMTAFSDPTLEAEAARLHAVLLAKPFRLEHLRRVVLTTLAAGRSGAVRRHAKQVGSICG